MTGRNYGVRLTYLDPRLNSVPAEFRFLAGQQFHGYANEVNILNKVKRLYGKEWEQVMKTLNVGEFIRVQATHEPTKIQVPLYHSPTRPEPYKPPEPAKKPHQHKFVVNYQPGTRERIQVPKQPGVITVNPPQSTQSNQLLNLLAGFLFTICTYTVIHQFIIRHLI